jgi:penicillin-binding protein 2
MRRDADREKSFARRSVVLASGKLLLFGALAGRLYQLQVLESSRYQTLAEDNRINLQLLAPPRGRILDRTGRPLAVNELSYRVLLVAEQAGNVDAVLDTLDHILELDDGERQRILREIGRRRRFLPVTVRDNLTWEEVVRIEVNAPELPGVSIDETQSRRYPHGDTCAHVVGYVAAVSEGEDAEDPLLQLPDFRIGKGGIEKAYDRQLRGRGGRSEVEVNAYGRIIRELARREGRPGADVVSTIDLDLQRRALDLLQGESGAIVLMDVHSGEVLALASNPTFDPNPFARGLTAEEWRALVASPRKPLTNKAIAGQYAPGSTFKMAVALAGLERGVITPATRVSCGGSVGLGNARFHCWKRGGHGSVNLHQALVQSCDVYFYEVASRVGVDRISAVAHKLGLGRTLDLDVPGERIGLLPTRDWKLAAVGEPWQAGETLITGIGQGYVLATPLQLAVMTARLVNGGLEVMPRLARSPADHGVGGAADRPRDLGFSAKHLKLVVAGMIDVVNSRGGTARAVAIRERGLEMGGKTGTSQVRRISRAERAAGVTKNEQLPWHRRDHALFVGFAPTHAPRYAVAVIIEHGGGGSKAAAPRARDMLLAVQKPSGQGVAELPSAPAGGTPTTMGG